MFNMAESIHLVLSAASLDWTIEGPCARMQNGALDDWLVICWQPFLETGRAPLETDDRFHFRWRPFSGTAGCRFGNVLNITPIFVIFY